MSVDISYGLLHFFSPLHVLIQCPVMIIETNEQNTRATDNKSAREEIHTNHCSMGTGASDTGWATGSETGSAAATVDASEISGTALAVVAGCWASFVAIGAGAVEIVDSTAEVEAV